MGLGGWVARGWTRAGGAKAPTAEQGERVAQQIEASLRKGDPEVFAAAFDNSRFLDRMVGKFKLEPQERAQFLRGMLLGDALGKQFVTNNNNGGSYRLLRVRPVDGKPRALFRMVQDSSAVNYHDMVFELNGKGDPVIVDIAGHRPPRDAQDIRVCHVGMHAKAPHLDHLALKRLKRAQLVILCRIAARYVRAHQGQHPKAADKAAAFRLPDEDMCARCIKGISVRFNPKALGPKRLRCSNIWRVARRVDAVAPFSKRYHATLLALTRCRCGRL